MAIVIFCLFGALVGGAAGWVAGRLRGHARVPGWVTAGAWIGFIVFGAALMIQLAITGDW